MDAYDLLVQRAAEGTLRGAEVEDEAARIRDLPVANYEAPAVVEAAVAWASEKWSRGRSCPMQFRPIQAVALFACHLNGGGFLPIGTGHGKELIFRLAASALDARKPLGLIPPDMREPFALHTPEYARSFKLPGNLRVMAYSQLSMASSTDALEKLLPDVIVCDEAHLLRNAESARVKRVTRFLREHPTTRVVLMSGTLTSKSVMEYAHLAEWALKHRSPVPRKKFFPVLESFSAVLDAKPTRSGDNGRFHAEARTFDWVTFSPLFPDWEAWGTETAERDPYAGIEDGDEPAPEDLVPSRVAEARRRWQQRLRTAPGVVATSTASVKARLCLVERRLQTPPEIVAALEKLEETWDRPDGEPLTDAIAKWRCGRQLSQGFYYRWKWPAGGPTDDDKEWLRTRRGWHSEVRRVCGYNRPHLDSPMLVGRAARRALDGDEDSPLYDDVALLHALGEWKEHEHRRWGGNPTPPTETVWIDPFLVDDAMRWFEAHPKGLMFYWEGAIEEALAARGVTIYGGGTNPEELAGLRGAALSAHSHRQGKNLQKHHEALILSFEPHAGNMEQLLSRTHRAGQKEDEVRWWYYSHTEPARQAIRDARAKALYTQTTMGDPQRLCYADWVRDEK